MRASPDMMRAGLGGGGDRTGDLALIFRRVLSTSGISTGDLKGSLKEPLNGGLKGSLMGSRLGFRPILVGFRVSGLGV